MFLIGSPGRGGWQSHTRGSILLLSNVLLATPALPGIVYSLLDDGARTVLFQVLVLLFNIQALWSRVGSLVIRWFAINARLYRRSAPRAAASIPSSTGITIMKDLINASAMQEFRRARKQAALEEVTAHLTGKSADLLCCPDVREKLKTRNSKSGVLREIPLNAVVGSVERCYDFTRSFLPREAIDQHRWANVKMNLIKWPPIWVYQIDQAYFVQDGHHRVSVARQFGASHIQAYVIEISTRVPLSPDSQPDDLLVKAEYVDFLERTHLDELRPGADLGVSVPGQYRAIAENIEAHHHFLNSEQGREARYQEAVVHWYDEVYWPVVQVIREQGLLHDFPGRTETDLYLWVLEHHAALENELRREVELETAAASLVAQFSSRPRRVIARVVAKILSVVTSKPQGKPILNNGDGELRDAPVERDRLCRSDF